MQARVRPGSSLAWPWHSRMAAPPVVWVHQILLPVAQDCLAPPLAVVAGPTTAAALLRGLYCRGAACSTSSKRLEMHARRCLLCLKSARRAWANCSLSTCCMFGNGCWQFTLSTGGCHAGQGAGQSLAWRAQHCWDGCLHHQRRSRCSLMPASASHLGAVPACTDWQSMGLPWAGQCNSRKPT